MSFSSRVILAVLPAMQSHSAMPMKSASLIIISLSKDLLNQAVKQLVHMFLVSPSSLVLLIVQQYNSGSID